MSNPTLESVLNTNNPVTVVSGANLNALASGSSVLGSAFSNVISDGSGSGFREAIGKLHLDSMTVSAGGIIDFWFLPASDGAIYSQGSSSIIPLTFPWYFFTVPVAQTAAIDIEIPVFIPNCAAVKCLLRNNSLGAAMPSNNNGYLKLYYLTDSLTTGQV